MESWPLNAMAVNIRSILPFIAPFYEVRVYEDGNYLARKGEVANCVFYIKEGNVIVSQIRSSGGHENEDEDEDDSVSKLPNLYKAH